MLFFQAAKLEYSPSTGVWVKGGRVRHVMKRRVSKLPTTSVTVVNDMNQKRVLSAPSEDKDDVQEEEQEILTRGLKESSSGGVGERVLHMEGEMEKKSPAHNLWQGRWFKLMTKQRESVSGELYLLHDFASHLSNHHLFIVLCDVYR